MNPKIKITVDAKNKAIAAFEGMATVGAKIDVEITGLPSGIEDWGADDDFVGKSVRFRVVDELGHDLVRFPVVKKTTATDGDQWQVVSATSTTPETYKTYNGTTYAQVDFDTDKLRKAFCGVAFNDKLEFGVIIDSIVDAAEFAVGKMKIQQWAVASTEDPTVLPDWRNVVKTVLDAKDEAVEAAGTATTQAGIATTKAGEADASKQAAAASATSAGTSESNALSYKTAAETAKTNAEVAQALAETAKTNAETAQAAAEAAASKYPYVDENGHWKVWENGAWVDKGSAKGDKGDTGETGAQGPQGPKGDDGEDGSIVSVSSAGTATDEVRYITIDGVEKKLAGGGDMKHSEFSSLTTLTNATLNQVANKVNEIINKLKPATAMFMAMLGFATFGDLGPNTQFGNVPPTSTLSEVVTAGGGITVERDPVAVPYVTAVSNKLEVAISAKQNELVSGTNIKTINGQSLLGSGNIVIQGGGGGADTNTVNDLIRSYDTTNLTSRFDAKVDAKYTWMRPNDWTISYAMSNTSRDVTSSYATTDSSYRVISNIVYSTGYGHAGQAYLTMLDPTSEEKSGIDSFFAVDSGITIDSSSGEFSTFDDGLFKIGARRLGEVRYAEIASQILSNSVSKTDSYYADDVAGTARKMVNDTAISVLYAATFVKSNDYVEVKGGVTNHHRYAVYNTFQPRMTGTGAGNVAPFAVSQHILASCKHYGEWIRWKGNQTFNDGQGHSATVTKLEWVSLSDWAATNGFSEAEIAYADIDDIMLIRCSKATAVPDGCIPYFMTETAMHNIFGESMRGVCAWACTQDLIYAIPVVMENEHTPRRSPSYYDKYEDPSTGILGFSRADACRRLEQMGLQYYVHSGDSGKPIFVNVNGNPVILTAWGYSDHLRNNYVRGYRIIKAFVENYGDTLKGYEL